MASFPLFWVEFQYYRTDLSLKQVRVADPTFLGYFMDKGVDAAAKVVRKVIICLGAYHTSIFFFFFELVVVILLKVCCVEDDLHGLHLSFSDL